ncbi:hypothetical protein RTBOTA2_000818 [Rhodotorula toruloides]|nr:hypothetical protein RTBOTA2_000818 [Rhodotorula toruloides]
MAQRKLGGSGAPHDSFDDAIEHPHPRSASSSSARRSADQAAAADDLADSRGANERTALLGSTTSRDYATEARRDRRALAEAGHPEAEGRRRPWSLRIDFAVALLLLFANGYFWTMSMAGVRGQFIANTALPKHAGSMGLPVLISFLACATNTASLLAFAVPHESPMLAFYTSILTAIFALTTLIISVSVTQLRVVEGPLTFIVLALAIVSALHAALSAALTDRYAPILDPPEELDPDYEPETGCWSSTKHGLRSCLGFLGISLPIAAAHIVILVGFILITINAIVRSVDASVEQPGQRWKVQPWLWQRRNFPELGHGFFQPKGREYRVHLSCRGIGLDDPPQFTASPSNTSSALQRPTVRRTIVVESERGIPGALDAEWVLKMLREGDLNSGDIEVRVCFWDRPGYGFSDASSTSSAPHIASALTQVLSVSGELARLEPPPSLEGADDAATVGPPSPLARSGLILVSRGESTALTSLFASIHPRIVHSFLYITPVSPSTHYLSPARSRFSAVPAFFTRTIPALWTELGIKRTWWAIRGVPRRRRVLAREGERVNGLIERAGLQEAHELDLGREADGAKAWERRRGRYPTRPTVVLGKSSVGDGGKKFVDDVVGEGLREWDREWKGGKSGCGSGGEAEQKCRDAVRSLMSLD